MTGYLANACDILAPPTPSAFWDWCGSDLRVEDGSRWRSSQASPFAHWYRLIGARLQRRADARDPAARYCEQLYLSFAAQVTKTTLMAAAKLHCLAGPARRIGWYSSSESLLTEQRETRSRQMALATPSVECRIPRSSEARERALKEDFWQVGGSTVYWKIATVPDDWRALPLDLILADEFDRYPLNVGGYGDPIEQGLQRQRNFPRTRLLIATSTPGSVAGHCWRRTVGATFERFHFACPYCGGRDWLEPRRVCLADGRELPQTTPAEITAANLGRYVCPHCGVLMTDADLRSAIRAAADCTWVPGSWSVDAQHPDGHWVPQWDLDAQGRLKDIHRTSSIVRSGQACSLLSDKTTLSGFAARIAAGLQGSIDTRRAVVNGEWGEALVTTAKTESSTDDIAARSQPSSAYALGELPSPRDPAPTHLALMIDQQENLWDKAWFPWVLRAFAPGGHSWLIDCGKCANEQELDKLCTIETWRILGTSRRPDIISIDSANGNVRFDIYRWVSKDPSRRICVRGDPRLPAGIPWQEVVDAAHTKRRTPKPAGVREYRIAPHYWRSELAARIARLAGHPQWWLPHDPPEFYLASLTSEEQVIEKRRIPGAGWHDAVVWKPRAINATDGTTTLRKDNHWWDCEADLCAIASIRRYDRVTQTPKVPITETPPPSNDFMTGYSL